jgi:Predicted acetyltransferase
MDALPPFVRRTDETDLDAVVEVLVRSHLDYVWERWALPVPDRRDRLDQLFRSDIGTLELRAGEVWMTGCGASVAVWLPTRAFATLDRADIDELDAVALRVFGLDQLAVVEEVEDAVARHRPAHDWFLATMGTLPLARRAGLGSAVLRPRLMALDAAGERASLETSTPENVRYYRRFGFDVVAELDRLPHGAPTTWLMVREPAGPVVW